MKKGPIIVIALVLFSISLSHQHHTEEEINEEVNQSVITYGSALRIENNMTKFHLYSNKYTWGTGSQLQIITSTRIKDDPGAIWIIKEGHGQNVKETGTAVKCNDLIRLEHSQTGKNLHSHNYKSWISDSQEACGFGDNGVGDSNDDFRIICYSYSEEKIKGAANFFLQHEATQKYLYINIKSSLYDERNCRNCPIIFQREVSLTSNKDKQCIWKVAGGLIYKENEE